MKPCNTPRPPHRGELGMSLVEVLVALLILGFVALGIASLFSHAQLTNASGYSYAVLASEARRALEELQGLGFDAAALADTGAGSRVFAGAAPGFTILYTVNDFGLNDWNDVFDFTNDLPREPATWPAAVDLDGDGDLDARLKRITLRVTSDNDFLSGRRDFVVSTLRIAD